MENSFCEIFESNTCEVNSPFSSSSSSSSSSSEEEEVVQSKSGRGRKRTRRAIAESVDADFKLGWKEQIQMIQKSCILWRSTKDK